MGGDEESAQCCPRIAHDGSLTHKRVRQIMKPNDFLKEV